MPKHAGIGPDLAFLVAFLAVLRASAASAQPALEVPEGPVVSSSRVLGMGGAYAGIAEGADGHLINPASFATRFPYTRRDVWDWDWTGYLLRIPARRNPDSYGEAAETAETLHVGGGLDFKILGFGAGFHVNAHGYDIADTDGIISVQNVSAGLGLGYSLHAADVVLGSYAYAFNWLFEFPLAGESRSLNITGGGSRVGLLWIPDALPVRLGLVARTSFDAQSITEDSTIPVGRTPRSVYIPAQVVLGASYMWGERDYNPQHTWGLPVLERAVPQSSPNGRRYLLFASDLVITGASPSDTVSMRRFLTGVSDPAGRDTTAGLRFGAEAEVVDNWLVLRSGYYFEPTRTDIVRGRHHFTGGLAVRIPFPVYDLRANGVFDVARDYSNVGVGMGFWH